LFFDIDKWTGIGYNRIKESDIMSTREKIKRDIDIMPDYIIQMFDYFWETLRKQEEERDEESFLKAIEDCETGNVYGPYYSVKDAMKAMLEE
jgi:hypothetical protein